MPDLRARLSYSDVVVIERALDYYAGQLIIQPAVGYSDSAYQAMRDARDHASHLSRIFRDARVRMDARIEREEEDINVVADIPF